MALPADLPLLAFPVDQYELCLISDALETLTQDPEGNFETAILHDARRLLARVNTAVAERDHQRLATKKGPGSHPQARSIHIDGAVQPPCPRIFPCLPPYHHP